MPMSEVARNLLPGEAIIYTAPMVRLPVYIVGALLIPCFGFGLLVIAYAWLTFRSTEIVVTNLRVIRKVGILATTTDEIRLDQIESVYATSGMQPHVEVVGSGGTRMKITGISSPDALRNAVQHATHALRTR
jgi:hypothetical protein